MQQIKIITINTWKCDGDYDTRLPLLARELGKLKPDIIACQECFESDTTGADTLQYLAKELKMEASLLPGRFKQRLYREHLVDSYSSLGVLSVHPIIPVEDFALPGLPDDEDRKMQVVSINIPGEKSLLMANIHLTHIRNVAIRRAQAAFAAERLLDFDNHHYRIICGDFNAKQEDEELRTFRSMTGAIDCYAAGNGTEPRYSLADAFAQNKLICVDHIMALPFPGAEQYPAFIDSSIVLNLKDEETGLYPSDHFGICTTLLTT